jgi:hypothetical protein
LNWLYRSVSWPFFWGFFSATCNGGLFLGRFIVCGIFWQLTNSYFFFAGFFLAFFFVAIAISFNG